MSCFNQVQKQEGSRAIWHVESKLPQLVQYTAAKTESIEAETGSDSHSV